MDAQLVGAPGQRLQFDPRRAVARAFDDAVASLRCEAAVMDVLLLAARSRLLGERQVDLALLDVGHPDDQRPIGLLRTAVRKALAEIGRVARSDEHTSELQSPMRLPYAVFCLV